MAAGFRKSVCQSRLPSRLKPSTNERTLLKSHRHGDAEGKPTAQTLKLKWDLFAQQVLREFHSLASMHEALDKGREKDACKQLVGQVDTLIDTLYFTYGKFCIDGSRSNAFIIVHEANMGIFSPWWKSSFWPSYTRFLKPDDCKYSRTLPSDNHNVSLKLMSCT